MTKCLPIISCDRCPSFDHQGAFGRIAYIPVCRRLDQTLGYAAHPGHGARLHANYDGVIPPECPLPDYAGDS